MDTTFRNNIGRHPGRPVSLCSRPPHSSDSHSDGHLDADIDSYLHSFLDHRLVCRLDPYSNDPNHACNLYWVCRFALGLVPIARLNSCSLVLADGSERGSEDCAKSGFFSDSLLELKLRQDWPTEPGFLVSSGSRSCFPFRHAQP
jgi:hypothetical protein